MACMTGIPMLLLFSMGLLLSITEASKLGEKEMELKLKQGMPDKVNKLIEKEHFDIFNETAFNSNTSGCGGLLNETRGDFSSPNYPSNYPNNAGCYWTIAPTGANQITLIFGHFETEKYYDYVTVYDGNGTFIRKFSGSLIPAPIKTSSNRLYVTFHTDYSVTRQGFKASYKSGTNETVTECGGLLDRTWGRLSSPNYPFDYPNNADCYWIIAPIWGNRITLTFHAVEMENRADYVDVYDGRAPGNGTFITRVTGSWVPPPIHTSSNRLFVTFHTDSSVRRRGFHASYSSDTTSMTTELPSEECGGLLNETRGFLHSPNYPYNYPNNADCHWIIAPTEANPIMLTFHDVKMENYHDYVEVRAPGNGSLINGTLIAKVTGNRIPPPIYTSSSLLYVTFHSDSSETWRGFNAFYQPASEISPPMTTELPSVECGGLLNETRGLLRSPNYPYNYPNNADCHWIIAPTEANPIMLIFHDVYMENHHDYVEVYDGSSPGNGSFITRVTGNRIPPPIYTSSNLLYVTFHSDSSVTRRGFNAFYQPVPEIPPMTTELPSVECGGLLHQTHGVLASPYYPSNYPNNADCYWIIAPRGANPITLIFDDVEMENQHDYVMVYDGRAPGNGTFIAKVTGSQVPPPIRTSSHRLFVTFHSDSSITRRGFKAIYKSGRLYQRLQDMLIVSKCIRDHDMICSTRPGCTIRTEMGHQTDCTKRMRCSVRGEWYTESCPEGTQYDYRSCSCTWPSYATCFTPDLCPTFG